MTSLHQANGRNWRQITLSEDGITFEVSNPTTTSSQFFSFRQLGRRSNDYTYLSSPDPQFSRNVMILGIYVAIVLTFVFEALSSAVGQKSTTPLSIAFGVLGIISALSMFVQLFVGNRKRKFKKIHFRNGGFITVYYRNSKDIDQVTALEAAIDEGYNGLVINTFVKALETDPTDKALIPWLENLHEVGHVTDEAYIQYKQKLKKAVKPKKTARKSKT